MTPFRTPPLVLNLIEEARKSKARNLDLSAGPMGFAMPALPLEVLDIEGLESLNFSGHALSALPAEFERARHLEFLDVRRNPIRRLPDGPLPPLSIDSLQ